MTTSTIIPNAVTRFTDNSGNPLAGGYVYFYLPNTTTPADTWQDSTQTVLNTNPVQLDSAGGAQIYGIGSYRQIVKDAQFNLIWDFVTYATASDSVTATALASVTAPSGASMVGIQDAAGWLASTNVEGALAAAVSRPVSSKATPYTVVGTDNNTVLTTNQTLLTFTLTAAATLGNGFHCIFTVPVGSVVTLTGGTINGLSTVKMGGGCVAVLVCDGAAFTLARSTRATDRIDVISSSSMDCREDVVGSLYQRFTGGVTVTGITLRNGEGLHVLMGTATIINNGASLINIGGTNTAFSAGDVVEYMGDPSSVTRMMSSTRLSNGGGVIANGLLNTGGDTTINVPTGAFKDGVLKIRGLTAGTDYAMYMRANGDTGNNYNNEILYSNGATAPTHIAANAQSAIVLGRTDVLIESTTNALDVDIRLLNFSSAFNKNLCVEMNTWLDAAGANTGSMTRGRWLNTAVITTLTILLRGSVGASPTGATINASAGSWYIVAETGA